MNSTNREVEIEIKIKPSFFVIDDNFPIEDNINYNNEQFRVFNNQKLKSFDNKKEKKGKRVIYFNNIRNITCKDPDLKY